jgi:hypothetical protein
MTRTKLVALCGLAALLAPGMARAQADHPLYLPTRDVAVTYTLDHEGPGAPKQAHMYFSAGTNRLRLERPNQRGFLIIDRAAKIMTVVMGPQHLYFQMPLDPEMASGFILNGDMKFVRGGSETIAGQNCTDWQVESSRATGTVCVTNDGVLLLGRGKDKNGNAHGGLQAAEVSYEQQPLSLFVPPAGFTQIDISQAARALGR